jgi:hypothetical protein
MPSSRKPLRPPVVSPAFLDGAPIAPAAEAKPARKARAVVKREPEPQPEPLTLSDVEVEPTRLVSLKIPLKMFTDIDEIRRHSRVTLTDIFVKSAAPQVARLMEQLKKRQGGAQ